jgi:hypothetical protein
MRRYVATMDAGTVFFSTMECSSSQQGFKCNAIWLNKFPDANLHSYLPYNAVINPKKHIIFSFLDTLKVSAWF